MKSRNMSPFWAVMLVTTLAMAVLLNAGCGSGGFDEPTVDEPTVDPVTNPDPPTGPEPTAIETLIGEIRLTAAAPIIAINKKMSGGEELSPQENLCLGDFDPAMGESATAVVCQTPLLVPESIIVVAQAVFENSDACQAALSQNTIDACALLSADVLIPIEWIAGAGLQLDRIGAPQPIAGAKINYNIDIEGKLVLTESAQLTGVFTCIIDTQTAVLEGDNTPGFDCSKEAVRISDRLATLRPAQL